MGPRRRSIARVERELGSICVLVNNAVNGDRHRFSKVTPDYWADRMVVDLRHQFLAAQAAHPQMKAAVHGLTRGLARDFGSDRIRANTVVPGGLMTGRQVTLRLNEAGGT